MNWDNEDERHRFYADVKSQMCQSGFMESVGCYNDEEFLVYKIKNDGIPRKYWCDFFEFVGYKLVAIKKDNNLIDLKNLKIITYGEK